MKVLKITFLCSLILSGISTAQNFSYLESFEENNPFVFWTSNAPYTVNYFGISDEKSFDGTFSLKMDITVNGNGDNDCYYYWKLPVKTNLHGVLDYSAYLWMDNETANYVKLGYHYAFPPTAIERTPTVKNVDVYNDWYKQQVRLSDEVMYHADYFAKNKIYGSTYDDFGRELQFIQLIIRAKGEHRFIFYIDKIEISGDVLEPGIFIQQYTEWWNNYQVKLAGIVSQKHNEFSSLPVLPDISGLTLNEKALEYYNSAVQSKSKMEELFTQIDNSEYFAPTIMDSLNTQLNLYPSWINLFYNELSNSTAQLDIFSIPPTLYNRLDETSQPKALSNFDKLSVKLCSGEYEPLSIILQAKNDAQNIRLSWTDFIGSNGTLSSSILDVHIAKVWYQAGITEIDINNKLLTQELLIKNDNLIKVDKSTQTNYLLVTNSNGSSEYIDISSPTAVFPENVTISDSPILLPFNISSGNNKQLWFTIHAPNAMPGIYTSIVKIFNYNTEFKSFPIEIEILPFNLDQPLLTYGIYYHGYLDNYFNRPFHYTNKTESQMRIELTDMKERGILYPTTYQILSNLDGDLNLRNQAGLPNDKLFTIGLKTGNPQTQSELEQLKSQVNEWKNKLAANGYQNLYVYGIDEASGDLLKSQKLAWQAVQEAGAKVFVAGYYDLIQEMKELIDVGVVLGSLRKDQSDLYHSYGKGIFSYSNPQSGHENPEVYRRNYGIVLWKAGYDGAMDYAYQKNYGSTWNDFDHTKYRDMNFTYPITNGVLSTIQWEGFREGIDDVRYLSTLLNRIDHLKKSGVDVSEYEQWINAIDPSVDPDIIRKQIIDKILYLKEVPVDNSPAVLENIVLLDSISIMINFNKGITSEYAAILSNYIITPVIEIKSVEISEDYKTIILTTSPHSKYTSYSLSINNFYDFLGNPISVIENNYFEGTILNLNLKVNLAGAYNDGFMRTDLKSQGLLPLTQPYNKAPWNYTGNENVANIPENTVDWLLVELRDTGFNLLLRKAVLLRNDGIIMKIDGSENITLENILPGLYYIIIRHRNHLPVMSSQAVEISENSNNYDFSLTAEQSFGKDSQIKLNNNFYAMISGDGDANGSVNILDYTPVKGFLSKTGYYKGDYDLNGVVDDMDYKEVQKSVFKHIVLPF